MVPMTASIALIILGTVVAVIGFVVASGLVTFVGGLGLGAGVLLFLVTGQRTRLGSGHR